MAATIAVLGTSVFNTTAGNKTITATPTVGDLIVIITAATGVSSTMSDNGTGGTYTQVDSTQTGFSTTGNLQMWVRNNLVSSATSTVYTATQTSSTGGGLVILRITGMTVSGAAAIRSSGGQSSGTAASTPAPVLSSTPLTTNPVIMAVANASGTTTTLTPRTGYTENFDNGYSTPTTGLEVANRASGETNATLTAGGTSATAFASIAAELAYDTAPTVALNAPADAGTVVTTTPQLTFTGTDADSEGITYEVQVDTVNTFDSGASSSIGISIYGLSAQARLIGYDTINGVKAAQSITPASSATMTSARLYLSKVGSPSDNLTLTVDTTIGGSSLGTSNAVAASILTASGSPSFIDFTFSSPVALTGTTKYYLTLQRSGANSTADYIRWEGSNGGISEYSGGGRSQFLTSWGSEGIEDLYCYIYFAGGPSLDKISKGDTGFTDITNGAHTDPFTSGEQIGYTVQAGDALTNGSTYYWRVRGKDPSGTNTYGAWPTARSFTVSLSVPTNQFFTFF